MKRLMLMLTVCEERSLQLVEFDKQAALDALFQGKPVIPFWSDLVHRRLKDKLESFYNSPQPWAYYFNFDNWTSGVTPEECGF